jgi:ABC-type nitrate/sulfonate/bicarbonate transport system substrate-binding protein
MDCAPLVAAQENGFFEREDLKVELHKVQSWGQVVTRLSLGDFEAAHMLVTMPLQWSLGLAGRAEPVAYAFAMSHHGSAVTLSNFLWREGVRDAKSLKIFLDENPNLKPLRLAVVHPRSTHEYFLRLWLHHGGMQVGPDIDLRYVPPPQMVHELREGIINGFCVAEPWNQRAASSKLGYIVATSQDVLPPMNEKVLGVRVSWHRKNPGEHAALLRAVQAGADWLADPANVEQAALLISSKRYVNTPAGSIRAVLRGELHAGGGRVLRPENFLRFSGNGANFPDPNHARYYLEQMWRHGHISAEDVQSVNLPDICLQDFYRMCIGRAGVAGSSMETYGEFLSRFPKSQ